MTRKVAIISLNDTCKPTDNPDGMLASVAMT